jgi:sec-independent protein translocase protein TatC
MLTVAALGAMGLVYAHNVLIPFLLQYLAEDSAASGLQSTWQLQSWVGFITGLYFSSILGFQVPILAVLLLRSGLIERRTIVENRGAIWFAALFLGALISPPDPISLFLVGGPMLVLLEVALLYEGLGNRE